MNIYGLVCHGVGSLKKVEVIEKERGTMKINENANPCQLIGIIAMQLHFLSNLNYLLKLRITFLKLSILRVLVILRLGHARTENEDSCH